MSTRCNLRIDGTGATPRLYLYRHWDGYLSETGAHILKTLRALSKGNVFHRPSPAMRHDTVVAAQVFLSTVRSAYKSEPARVEYELTGAAHGDIEYFYAIDVTGRRTRIGYACGYGPNLEHEAESAIGSLTTFAAAIRKEGA